jgi:hypothetical protein
VNTRTIQREKNPAHNKFENDFCEKILPTGLIAKQKRAMPA